MERKTGEDGQCGAHIEYLHETTARRQAGRASKGQGKHNGDRDVGNGIDSAGNANAMAEISANRM